jgi:hypothetical protein
VSRFVSFAIIVSTFVRFTMSSVTCRNAHRVFTVQPSAQRGQIPQSHRSADRLHDGDAVNQRHVQVENRRVISRAAHG